VTRPAPPPAIVRHLEQAAAAASNAVSWVGAHFTLVAVGFLTAAILTRLVVAARRRRGLARTATARNLADRIGPKLGWKNAQRFVTWPRNPQATGAPVTIRYPKTFTALPAQVQFIPDVIASLAGGEWALRHDAAHHRLIYTRQPPPATLPDRVDYPDRPTDRADLIPFAQTTGGQWVNADLTGLTPHILISATTGFGKTSIISVLVAHLTARGATIDIIDPKQIGFLHLDGLPPIHLSTDIDAMTAAVEQFRADMEHRYQQIRAAASAGRPTPAAPLRILVLDELGSFADMCVDAWQAAGNKGTPPVFRSVKRILWQGRAAGFHVIAAAQQANVKTTFGVSDVRDQFGLRIAAGPQSTEAWRMLFGTEPRPDGLTGDHRGRAVVGVGATFHIAQLAHLNPADARRIAARGRNIHPANQTTPPLPTAVDAHVDNSPVHAPGKRETPVSTAPSTPRPAAAVTAESPGAAPEAPPVTVPLECGGCGRRWDSTARPGSATKCPACRRSKRVPVAAHGTAPDLR
jgi:hypothetical protein